MTDTRPKRDTRNPCAVCGWSKHMAIHQPIIAGKDIGKPYGHAYVPMTTAKAQKGKS